DCDAGTDLRVRIVQRPAGAARGAPWPLRFRVDFEHARGARESHIVQLDARHTELRLPCRAGALPRIVLDAGDDAYALVALDPAQVASAGAALGRTRCALQRMRLWEQVWQSVRECRSDPAGFVMLALQALARERSELIVAAVLQRLQDAMDRLLAPERASSLALAVDRFLLDAAGTATPSLRPAWLEGLIAVARSREGLDALEAIARGRRDALGAPATLHCRAALMLVVRGRWDLRRAREAIQACGCASMPVRWQLAAARPSAGSKRDVLEALLTHRRATDEAIVGALGLLNHPAHAALTAPLLAPALQGLPSLH